MTRPIIAVTDSPFPSLDPVKAALAKLDPELRMPPNGVIINRDAAIGRKELAGFGEHQRINL